MKGHPILLDTNIVSYIMLKSSLGAGVMSRSSRDGILTSHR